MTNRRETAVSRKEGRSAIVGNEKGTRQEEKAGRMGRPAIRRENGGETDLRSRRFSWN